MNDEVKLPIEGDAPPALEERIVAELHARGLLRKRPKRWLLPLAAALALVFAAGVLVGRYEPRRQTYALLLHEAPNPGPIEEYIRWSRNDFIVGGEKLADEARFLQSTQVRDGHGGVGGFFLIAADSLDSATKIARTCPHLKYGGTIEVRAVDR